MANIVQYGDISPRTAAYVVKELLKRAVPYMVIEKFGQQYPIPLNSTRNAKFRRYFLTGATGSAGDGVASEAFFTPLSMTPLLEGVTPSGLKLDYRDYVVQLNQYGDFIQITDVVEDTHEDPVLSEATQILSESAAQTFEAIRYNVLKAGTNVFYNPTSRALTANPISLTLQRQITTALNRQNAKFITSIVSSTPNFRTEPVEAAYVGLIHPDLETDVRSMGGFIPTKQYGTVTPWENEIGAVERVRYLTSTVFVPFPDAATSVTISTQRSTAGNHPDVYPILYVARDAYGIVPLRGRDSLTPMVVNPKPAAGDPLGQRGSVGWKAWQAAVILQDAFLVRAEVTATA
jgi:N4-gp56 family major capsid protein